jgi:isopentenyl diphosphate isomerase/L-lactate dehydrogenase-like FMN-dependent dehydrogenase
VPLLIGPGVLALEDRECVDHILAGARSAGAEPVHPLGLRTSPQRNESRLFAAHWESFPTQNNAKVVASGITSVDAALHAVGRGARALLIESSSTSSIELLPAIRRAVPPHVELVASGAFRGANEVLIALALGARATTIGWPVIWGARASREGGAFRALDLIEWGLIRGLRLCGCPSITQFDHRFVREVRQLDLS